MAITDLAAQGEGAMATLSDISQRQGISLSYLEQLFSKLRASKLVKSHRGAKGGYSLAVPAEKMTLDRVIAAVDEDIKLHRCTPENRHNCTGTDARCMTHQLWDALEGHIETFLAATTIANVIAQDFNTPDDGIIEYTR